MTSDTVESAEPVAARILLVDDDLGARTELGNQLVMGGFDVRSLPDPTALQRTLGEWRPNLLILDELFPGTTGREVSLRLRAQGATFDIPVVGLLSEPSIPRALQWLRSGATDLWTRGTAFDPVERTQALLDELSQTRVHAADVRARLVAYARRRTLHGTVLFYPDTPFEGRVRFEFGALVSSRTGAALEGTSLDELLALDDAAARWVPGDEVVAVSGPPGGSYRPKVLVVEDDDALRGLLLKQLASYGTVEGAADGLEGLLKGTRQDFDVVVADLNLPGLDGWGLLRQLRQHTTAREAAIIVLSAHDELRETLKAARAGARAYLKKTGRAKPLLDTLERVLAPRKQAWDSLARREPTALDLRLVGPMWALRTIAELDLVGALAIEEPLGRFEVRVAHGQLVRAEAQLGVERLEGPGALEALLSSSGGGAFTPGGASEAPQDAPWLHELVEGAAKAASASLATRLRAALAHPRQLSVHPELSLLFARIATERELKVLSALRQAPDSVAALCEASGISYEEVEVVLAELLRRGVLSAAPVPGLTGLQREATGEPPVES